MPLLVTSLSDLLYSDTKWIKNQLITKNSLTQASATIKFWANCRLMFAIMLPLELGWPNRYLVHDACRHKPCLIIGLQRTNIFVLAFGGTTKLWYSNSCQSHAVGTNPLFPFWAVQFIFSKCKRCWCCCTGMYWLVRNQMKVNILYV